MNTWNRESEATYNYGVAILRIWMCMEVVFNHCLGVWHVPYVTTIIHSVFGSVAVPVFFMISFLFLDISKLIASREVFLKRIWRLFKPQVMWGSICWIVVYASDKLLDVYQEKITLKHLVLQIFTGSVAAINPSMWFQTDLIVATIIIAMLFYFVKTDKTRQSILILLFILCIGAQYSGMNYSLFYGAQYELIPFARFVEIFPACLAGVFMRQVYSNYSDRMVVHFKLKSGLSLILLMMVTGVNIMLPHENLQFGYAGLRVLITAIVLTIIFYKTCFTTRLLQNRFLKWISKSTEIIYYSHVLCRNMLWIVLGWLGIGTGSLLQCFAIFLMGMVIKLMIEMASIIRDKRKWRQNYSGTSQ